ncbi:DUF4153 domain-containing protein [Bradyrhizobium canariense]|uniref:Uncharacterized protein n=1 Tax=Bradyrhizobium canariense TaxID=255045 RepID=A0A1H2B0E1_9BRAD|nr:DUF4173 domain-containing protein [Bradyrhizobium canariense]SDT51479.1 protein of unknown function [Bradyrhizobium canariense]
MSIAATTNLERAPFNPLITRLATAIGCAALADWLFFGWEIGVSLALFLGVLGVTAVACNGTRAARPVRMVMTAVFVAGLAALIENVDMLSVTIGMLATAMFVIVMTAGENSSWYRDLFEAATVPFRGPFQFVGDVIRALRHMKRRTSGWLGSLVAWIVPLSIFAIFLGLFSSANPLIEYQLKRIDLRPLLEFLESWRLVFWVFIVCTVWPLLRRRVKSKPVRQLPPEGSAAAVEPSDLDYLLGEKAMSRSLILFNALFALQSGLDLAYLWGGANLPDGMSHAEYAHRGAYPLIATALLAAAFVLVAMRPGGPAENSKLIRPLVLVWVAQNILLVVSSIFRLDLYVAAFSLTYLRLAALIWMVLVATGLVLILIQIMRKKSNSWLLSANAISLALVLYACCFLNAPWLIASYNVEHSRELGGTGPSLDIKYLESLGSAQTLPPVEAHLSQFPGTLPLSLAYRASPDRNYLKLPGNWRAWNFRRWRLERYFANTAPERLNPSNNGKG